MEWEGLNDPDEIEYNIGGVNLGSMKKGIGDGNFTITLNSSRFSAGNNKETYEVSIYGSKLGYISPMPVVFTITIHAIITNVRLHDYNNLNQILTEVSSNYGDIVNITVSYYNTTRLLGAKLSYSWEYGSGVNIGEDPIHPGYYTFEINTSVFPAPKLIVRPTK